MQPMKNVVVLKDFRTMRATDKSCNTTNSAGKRTIGIMRQQEEAEVLFMKTKWYLQFYNLVYFVVS